MEMTFAPPFRKFVKKQVPPFQLAIRDEVDKIFAEPTLGEEKVGDLAGYQVHKFMFHKQEYLIAYSLGEETITFWMIGTHENFYRDLKAYIGGK
jgi:hypothetical protein